MNKITFGFFILGLMLSACAQQNQEQMPFTDSFLQDSCTFSTTGRNPYFVLEPGYQLVLENADDADTTRLVITVLDETKMVDGIETRVVEERETEHGELIEISRNYFAFCQETGNVFYFGEEVDMYKNGKITSHSGAWLAEGPNKAGVIMPGSYFLGARFYQEVAPGVAMDRAEIVSLTDTIATPAGTFKNCLRMEETSALERNAREYKIHAPGIGLVQDEDLLLVKHGFIQQ